MAGRRLIRCWVCRSFGILLIFFVGDIQGHTAALVWSKATRSRPKPVKAAAPTKKPTTAKQTSNKRASSARITSSSGKQPKATSSSKKKKPTSRQRRVSAARPGSRIPPERVIEIQNALISRGYLQGPPSGVYDGGTVAAMKKFQQAESLDATGYPTARVLNRLGLPPGPEPRSSTNPDQ